MSSTIFLASSSCARPLAKSLAAELTSDRVAFLPWWEAFTPGRTLITELDSLKSRVQGALLLITPYATANVKGRDVSIPNLNVLFEFGFMYGHFARERVSIVKYGNVYLPSDLDGYIHISGSKTFSPRRRNSISKRTLTEFSRWLDAAKFPIPPRSATDPTHSPAVAEAVARMRAQRAPLLPQAASEKDNE